MLLISLSLLVLSTCPLSFAGDSLPTVRTKSGLLRPFLGTSLSGRSYYKFTNIPYAQPPLGNLRFADPVESLPWNGVRVSKGYDPPCMQYNIFEANPDKRVSGSEDCLYLSVFTPRVGKGGLPVMVFIHGGGFSSWSGSALFGSEFLLDKEVVLVLLNYRLGALGFMSTEDSLVRGNMGLKDQAMALKWVQENIHHFGGSSYRVTLFGQSAGASSVHYHMMHPQSKQLFQRVILQSGSAYCPWALTPPKVARTRAVRSANFLGCPNLMNEMTLNCLRNKTAYDIAGLHGKFIEFEMDPPVIFGPVIENAPDGYITSDPFTIPTSNHPMMIGLTSDECSIKTTAMYASSPGSLKKVNDDFSTIIPMALGYRETSSNRDQITKVLRDFYFNGRPVDISTIGSLSNLYTDSWFLSALLKTLQMHSGPIYQYLFDHQGAVSFVDMFRMKNRLTKGATHCDDLLYLFNLTTMGFPPSLLSPADKKISKKMVSLWTQFAANGYPSLSWDQFDPSEGNFLLIRSDSPSMNTTLFPERSNLWKNLATRDNLKIPSNTGTYY